MATVPLPANIGSYAGRQLGGGDWRTLQQYGYNPSKFGQTIGGYQVYGAGQGDVRLRAVPGATTPATTTPAAAPIAPQPARPAAPAAPQYAAGTPGGTTPSRVLVPQGMGTTATTPQTPGGATVQTAFRDQLLRQLNQDPNAVTLQDPALAAQTRAFSDAQQRAIERQQQEAAEQGFAGGNLGTGAYRQQLAGLQQQRGEAESQYGAGLLGEARNQRMQELANALGLARETIAGGEDVGLRNAALAAQTRLGESDLALRGQLGRGQLGLGLLQALLGDRQAANQLGLNAGIAGMGFNQSAMQQLLQGMR